MGLITAPRAMALLSLVFAGAGLGTALASEHLGGLVPCALCLLERWPYRAAIALGLLALLWPGVRLARGALWAVVLCMGVSAGLAATHVGVEQAWWPSPLPECAAPNLGGGSIAQRLARMPARPAKPCDDPTYLVPGLPISMAAMNGVASLVLGGLLVTGLHGARPGRMRRRSSRGAQLWLDRLHE